MKIVLTFFYEQLNCSLLAEPLLRMTNPCTQWESRPIPSTADVHQPSPSQCTVQTRCPLGAAGSHRHTGTSTRARTCVDRHRGAAGRWSGRAAHHTSSLKKCHKDQHRLSESSGADDTGNDKLFRSTLGFTDNSKRYKRKFIANDLVFTPEQTSHS